MEQQKRKLDDRTETYYLIVEGHCKQCGTKVSKVIGSDCTNMSNGDRYHSPVDTSAWCLFRCDGCTGVISDTWVCDEPPKDQCSPPKHKTYRLTKPYFSKYRQACKPLWISEGDTVFKNGDAYFHKGTGLKLKIAEVENGDGFEGVEEKGKDQCCDTNKLTLEDCYLANGNKFYIQSTKVIGSGTPKLDDSRFLSCPSRIHQLIAICDLMAVADHLNGEKHWKPKEFKERFCFYYDHAEGLATDQTIIYCMASVYFKTKGGIDQALEILGEQTIKTALGL